jgi:hypothetical protein
MTEGLDDASEPGAARFDWRAGRHLRRRVLLAALRIVLVTVGLCGLYVLAPLERSDGKAVIQMCLALVAYTAILVWQIIAVARSSYPRLRAIEASRSGIRVAACARSSSSAAVSTARAASPASGTPRLKALPAILWATARTAAPSWASRAARIEATASTELVWKLPMARRM